MGVGGEKYANLHWNILKYPFICPPPPPPPPLACIFCFTPPPLPSPTCFIKKRVVWSSKVHCYTCVCVCVCVLNLKRPLTRSFHPCSSQRPAAEGWGWPSQASRYRTEGWPAQTTWSGDSSVVRVPDLWWKGCRLKSQQEQWDNFLLWGQLSVLTLILVSVPPLCYCSSTWKIPVILPKCRLQLNMLTSYVHGLWASDGKWCEMVHGCMVYTEHTKTAAVSHDTSHITTKQHCKYITLVDIKMCYKKLVTHLESHMTKVQRVCLRVENSAI